MATATESTVKEVTLTDGEKVQIDLNVCNDKQVFTRIGQKLIAGIVKDVPPHGWKAWQGVYIWYEVRGIYRRLGDISFHPQADGTVLWKCYAWTHNSRAFESRAAAYLANQLEMHRSSASSGNCVEMISIAPGVEVPKDLP